MERQKSGWVEGWRMSRKRKMDSEGKIKYRKEWRMDAKVEG